MPANCVIRRTTPDDIETVLGLIRGLADYEKLDPPDEEACARLKEHGWGSAPKFEAWIAEVDGVAVGYAVLFETYSSFLAKPTLYLEDIFLLPESRGAGVGKQFIEKLAAEAVARDCGRMEWVCLDWNTPSLGFYEKLGATQMHEWVSHRLDGEALTTLGSRLQTQD
ncbi:MAG: GNAT family N-acetyltransferase [Chthonomonadales bacterium]